MNIRKFPLRPAVRFLRYAFLVVVVVFWIRSHCVFDRLGWARNTVSGKSRVDHLLQFKLCNGWINFQMLTVKIPDVDAFYASAHIDGGENTAGSKFEWERLPKRLFDVRSTFMPGDREMRWSRAGFFFHQWLKLFQTVDGEKRQEPNVAVFGARASLRVCHDYSECR